jgi:hypothetical protein
VPGPFEEREVSFRLGGVSPAGLALWLRGMRASPVLNLAGLELIGTVPLSGPMAFDTARAEHCLRDTASEPLMPPPGGSTVVDAPSRDLAARLVARAGAKGVAAFDAAFANAMGLVPSPPPTDLRDRLVSAMRRLTAFPQVKGDAHEYAHLRFGSGDLSRIDLTTARRVFEAGVARLSAAGEIVSAHWCLGVAGTPAAASGASAPGYPYAERAKSGRAACVKCNQPIPKETVRVAIPRSVETPQGAMVRPGYLHLLCAVGYEGITRDATLANSPELDETGQAEVTRVLG